MDKVTIHYNNDDTEIYVYSLDTDFVSQNIKYYKNFYEYKLLSFLRTNFNNQKNIIDIGANIGNHSLFFAKYMNCNKIFSFEPFIKNIEIFKNNLINYKDKCTLFEKALSDKDGKMVLYNSEENNFGGFSLHKQAKSFEVLKEIDVVKLDNFNLTDVTLIKIDVENHENEVLLGSKQTILNNKPIIVLENSYYYFSHIFPNPNPHEEIFKELGYIKIFSNVCDSSMDIWSPIKL
jgi:FkbM family methyltransferase